MTSVQLKEPKKNAADLVFVSIIRNLAKQSLKDKVKKKKSKPGVCNVVSFNIILPN